MVKGSGTRMLLFKPSSFLSACVTLGKSLDTVGPRYLHTKNTGWQTAHVSMSELLLNPGHVWTICKAFGTKQVLYLLCDGKKKTQTGLGTGKKNAYPFALPQIELGGREHWEGFGVKGLGCQIPLSSLLSLF